MEKDDDIYLSLDEIISRQKKKYADAVGRKMEEGGNGGFMRARGTARGTFRSAQMSRPTVIPVIKNVRWESRFVTSAVNGRLSQVNISNLGPNVSTADLKELFSAYPFVDCAVHFDEAGRPLGTAAVHFKHFKEAMKLKRDFMGVRLDGFLMVMFAVFNKPKPRVFALQPFSSFPIQRGRIVKRGTGSFGGSGCGGTKGNQQRVNMGGFKAPSGGRRGRGKKANDPRKQLTSDDLDLELDEYMGNNNHLKMETQ